jgi:peptide/nickel transport system substrate-binding protein
MALADHRVNLRSSRHNVTRKPAVVGAAVVALAGLVTACSSTSTPAGTSHSGGTAKSTVLNIAFPTEITTLDPGQVCDVPSDTLVQNMYDDLVQPVVANGVSLPDKVAPMAASSWTVSDHQLDYVFHIRPGITFLNGDPLTAADVVYSYKRDIAAEGCTGYVLTGGLSNNIVSITAPTPMTVQFKFRRPDPLFLIDQTVHIGIVDEKLLNQHGGLGRAGNAWISTHDAGSGPFVLSSYDPSSEVVLTARSGYWGGTPGVKKIQIHIETDPSTLQLLANSGQFNLVYGLPLSQVNATAKQSGMSVISAPGLGYVNIGLNTKDAPLGNVLIRRALAYATPFKQLISTYGGGYAVPFVGPVLQGETFYRPYANPYPFSIARAKALLAKAGVPHPTLTMDVVAGASVEAQIATTLQSEWAQAGITLHIMTLGSSAWTNAVDGFKDQMYMTTDKSDSPDPAFMLGYFVACHNLFNWTQYCNQQVNSDLNQARFSTDNSLRNRLYQQISSLIIQNVPYLELYQQRQVVLASKSITGYVSYVDSCPRWLDVKFG